LRFVEFTPSIIEGGVVKVMPGDSADSVSLGSNITGSSGAWWLWGGVTPDEGSTTADKWATVLKSGSASYSLYGLRELRYDANGTGVVVPAAQWFIDRDVIPTTNNAELAALYDAPVSDVVSSDGVAGVFVGWDTNSTGDGVSYTVGGTVSLPVDGLTLFAQLQAPPVASDTSATIRSDGSKTFTASTAGTTLVGSVNEDSKVKPNGEGVSFTAGSVDTLAKVTFDAAGLAEGSNEITVDWTDDLGQVTTVRYTVVVQAFPVVVDNDGDTVGVLGTSKEFTASTTGVTVSGSVNASSDVKPDGKYVTFTPGSVDSPATVTFDASGLSVGSNAITVDWTDDLEQVTTVTYTVIVQAVPDAGSSDGGGEFATIGVVGSVTFTASTTGTGTLTGSVSGVLVSGVSGVVGVVGGPVVGGGGESSVVVLGVSVGGVVFTDGFSGTPATVTFYASGLNIGSNVITVDWKDNLNQVTTVTYTVIVQALPVVPGTVVGLVGVGETVVFDVGLVSPVDSVVVTPEAFNEFVSVSTSGLVTVTSKGLLPGVYVFALTWFDELGQSVVSEFTLEVAVPLDSVPSGGKLIHPIPSTALLGLGFLLLGFGCLLGTVRITKRTTTTER
jgi:hypothetical protein